MPAPRADLTPYDRYGSRLVAAKLDVLRLLRAIDHVGIPLDKRRTAFQQALGRLAEYDALLTSTLAVLDAQGRETPELPSTAYEQLLSMNARQRDDVLASLAPAEAAAVRRAFLHVHADAAEVLAEVAAMPGTELIRAAPVRARGGPLPTRNGACPCGSGAKYKKCCLAKDEAHEAARIQASPPALTRASAPAMHALDHRLVGRILEFARARYPTLLPEAVAEIERLGQPGHAEELVGPWLAYHAFMDDTPLLDHFLRHEASRLRPDELAWLEANALTPLSIWSIEHVNPGTSVRLRDALTGEVRTVIDRKGSESMRRGDGVCARVVDHQGLSLLVGMHGRALPPVETEQVAATLRAALPGPRDRAADVPVPREALAGENARTVLVAWCDAVQKFATRPPPVMQNTDGDLLAWTVDRYRFAANERAEVVQAVAAMAGVEPAELDADDPPGRTSFRRVVAGSKALGPDGWTSHGRIHIDANAVSVECNSTKRADRLRTELEAACGRWLTFSAREQQSIGVMRAKAHKEPPRPPPPAGPEIDALIRATKERAYDGWADQPVPGLNGATPRRANADPALRGRLEAILLSIEQIEARQPAAQRFDVGRIRRSLGMPTPKP